MGLVDAVIAAVTGGATGYITNDLAVKMLFKKYGPFGGIILDTRKEFARNVSMMVERDILNSQTIIPVLASYRFQKVCYQCTDEILHRHLYEAVGSLKWRDIPGYADASRNIIMACGQLLPHLAETIIAAITTHISAGKLLTAAQNEQIASWLSSKVSEVFSHPQLVENIIKSCYEENKQRHLDTWLDTETSEALTDLLIQYIERLPVYLQGAAGQAQLTVFWQAAVDTVDVEGLIIELQDQYGDLALQDVLTPDQQEALSEVLAQQVISFFKSASGLSELERMAAALLEITDNIDICIADVLDPAVETELFSYLQDLLPRFIEQAIVFIQKHKDDINIVIDAAVDDALAAEGSVLDNVRNLIKQGLKTFMLDNPAEDLQIVKFLETYLQKDVDISVTSSRLAADICNWLKKYSIGQLAVKLEKSGLISHQYLALLLRHNIIKYVKKNECQLLMPFKAVTWNDLGISAAPLANSIRDIITAAAVSWSARDDGLVELLRNVLTAAGHDIGSKALADMLPEQAAGDFAAYCQVYFDRHNGSLRARLQQAIAARLDAVVAGNTAYDLLGGIMPELAATASDAGLSLLEHCLTVQQGTQVTRLYDILNTGSGCVKQLTTLAIDASRDNIETILSGKIQAAVEANLKTLPDRELQLMVENFMGRELQPITRFGAILGLGAGLATAAGASAVPMLGTGTAAAAVYGLVGWLTNVIAIKMIFHPYKPYRLAGFCLPFTPGVIARQQRRFAVAMAEFVEDELLTGQAVQQLFAAQHLSLEQGLKAALCQEDCQLLRMAFADNSQLVADHILALVKSKLAADSQACSELLAGQLCAWHLSAGVAASWQKNWQAEALAELQRQAAQAIGCLFTKPYGLMMISRSDAMEEWLKGIFIGRLSKMEACLSSSTDHTAAQFANRLLQHCLAQPVDDILGVHGAAVMQQLAGDRLAAALVSETFQERLVAGLALRLKAGNTVRSMCSGVLGGLLKDNMSFIFDSLITVLLEKLRGKRAIIKQSLHMACDRYSVVLLLLGGTLDINRTVDIFVDGLLDNHLPAYLQEQSRVLQDKLADFSRKEIAERPWADTGIKTDGLAIAGMLRRFLNLPAVAECVQSCSDRFIAVLMSQSVRDICAGKSWNITEIEVPERLVAVLSTAAGTSIEAAKDSLAQQAAGFSRTLLEHCLKDVTLRDFFTVLPTGAQERCSSAFAAALTAAPAFVQVVEHCVAAMLAVLANKGIGACGDRQQLQSDLAEVLGAIAADGDVAACAEADVAEALRILSEQRDLLPAVMRGYCTDLLVDGILKGINAKLPAMLDALEVGKIVETGIAAMPPQELEAIFTAFAEPYFRKIEFYGLPLGAAFGIAADILKRCL